MQYSPKLKVAMDKIKDILKDADIAAFVVLHSPEAPGFSEYLNHVSPSYSCAKFDHEGLKVKLKTAEVGKEKAKQLADGTYNMIVHLTNAIAMHADTYITCCEMLKERWKGFEDPGEHSSHNEQNN